MKVGTSHLFSYLWAGDSSGKKMSNSSAKKSFLSAQKMSFLTHKIITLWWANSYGKICWIAMHNSSQYEFLLISSPDYTKAKLLLLKLIHLFAREVLLVKKLEIEETKTS